MCHQRETGPAGISVPTAGGHGFPAHYLTPVPAGCGASGRVLWSPAAGAERQPHCNRFTG